MKARAILLLATACSSASSVQPDASSSPDSGVQSAPDATVEDASTMLPDATTPAGNSPMLGGCPVLPSDHLFNTPIADLPPHPNSDAFMRTIGAHDFHLDLGTTIDQASDEYYGIPYNLVQGSASPWVEVRYFSADPGLDWNPREESDCASGAAHMFESPCTTQHPLFPIPADPLVEGGVVNDPAQPYGDHHILLLDRDTCMLWELYHAYPNTMGGWDIFGSARFDLRSNALRPADWSSADAAGFPILPLLLRAEEAASGEIRHALRFTINSDKIRIAYTWPARHLTNNGTNSADQPPMGQLFRLKSTYTIPAGFHTQSRAILEAMKTYGMYIADGGSDMYVTGEPSAAWDDTTFDEIHSVSNDDVEAVDLTPIMQRAGFDPDSARVPPR